MLYNDANEYNNHTEYNESLTFTTYRIVYNIVAMFLRLDRLN